MSRTLSFLALLLCFPGLAIAAEVQAVASFSILGDMVARVGGDRVAVTTIVGADGDAHVYEPTPADAVAVGKADIFFVNGLGFEGWLTRFIEATGFAGPLVVASEGVAGEEMVDEGETATDPHAWQSLRNGVVYVTNIARGLCAVDPEGCDGYEANAAAYGTELSALDAKLRAQIAAIPEARRKVITTHDAFGYFASAYGISVLAPVGVSTDSEASAADVARLIGQIRAEGVTALFIENMSDGRLLERIAAETGLSPGGELYSDALSGPDGPAPTYLRMFEHNAGLLVPAMAGD